MLSNCNKLKALKVLNQFNNNKVYYLEAMFQNCNELEYLDLSNFDTTNVFDMQFMFNQCKKLREIKGINNFKTEINV